MTLDYLATNSIAKFLAFSLKLPESFISVYARNKRNLTPIHNGYEDIDTKWWSLRHGEGRGLMHKCQGHAKLYLTIIYIRIYVVHSKGHASNWPTNLIIATFSKLCIGRSRFFSHSFSLSFSFSSKKKKIESEYELHGIKRCETDISMLFKNKMITKNNKKSINHNSVHWTFEQKKNTKKKLFNTDFVDFYPKNLE